MARRAPSAFVSLLGRLPPELQTLAARAAQELQNAAARGSSAMFQSYAQDAQALLNKASEQLEKFVVNIESKPVNDRPDDEMPPEEAETGRHTPKAKKKDKKKGKRR